jgi:uncharacterized protein
MKYLILLLTAFTLLHTQAEAQKKEHRIVFDMAGSDTADHNTIIRQVNNVLRNSPQTKVEVVFHGKAVYALMKDKTTVKDKIDDLVNNKQVIIAACNNSLNQLKLSKDDVIPSAIIVPVAMLELMDKQEKGWSYIKAGH